MAVGRHVLADAAPNVADERPHLCAVGLAHIGARVGLHETFVGAYAEHLHFHAYFLHKVFIEDGLRGYAVPVDHAAGVNQHRVGRTGHIIGALHEVVAVGQNEFS